MPEKKATAEDLIRLTKPITTTTAKAVAAGNSGRQEDVIICANMGRKAIFDLLATCRVCYILLEIRVQCKTYKIIVHKFTFP